MEARAPTQPHPVSPPELHAVTKGLPGGRTGFHDLTLTPAHSLKGRKTVRHLNMQRLHDVYKSPPFYLSSPEKKIRR